MAESIIVHFSTASWSEVSSWLDSHAVRLDNSAWGYPEAIDPMLFLYNYDDYMNEYEFQDLIYLWDLLGIYPSSALCLQMRRSKGNNSCDSAVVLARNLLEVFDGVADDTYGNNGENYWTLDELRAGVVKAHGSFLECYQKAINV